ncbi:MAG: type II secretion system F family protein [Phycisphaerales bacterium]|nr:type II secretion system F family protein [Phycisphaerales bacterium]
MPLFQYTALDGTGKRVAGVLSGASEQSILTELEGRSLVPVKIAPRPERLRTRRRGLAPRRLAEVYIQFGDMLQAGVPVLRALRVLAGQKDQRIAGVFREIAGAVSEGEPLAEAMSRRPDLFKPTQVAIIRAGEKGGFLEDAVMRLGQFVERQAELRGKLAGSLIYPIVLVSLGGIILVVIFTVLIPMVQPMFKRIEKLPAITEVVFAIAKVVGGYAPVVIGVLVMLGVAFAILRRRPGVKRWLDGVFLRLPAVGPLIRAIAVARFSRMLGTMLHNGVPMLGAMATSKAATGNVVLESAIAAAAEQVGAGAQLAPSLGTSGLFPADVIEMLAVGEEAGNVDKVLIRISDTVESRIERLLSNLIRLVEPLLIALIAAVVLVVAISLVLPLTQLSDIR